MQPALGGKRRFATINKQPTSGETELLFATGGAVSGSTGCNRFRPVARMEDRALVIDGPVAVTKKGSFLGAGRGEADGGHETSAARESDLNFIRVNDERYEIPDAVITGG